VEVTSNIKICCYPDFPNQQFYIYKNRPVFIGVVKIKRLLLILLLVGACAKEPAVLEDKEVIAVDDVAKRECPKCPVVISELGDPVDVLIEDIKLLTPREELYSTARTELVYSDLKYDELERADLGFSFGCAETTSLRIEVNGDEVYDEPTQCNQGIVVKLDLRDLEAGRNNIDFMAKEDSKISEIKYISTNENNETYTQYADDISLVRPEDDELFANLEDATLKNYLEYVIDLEYPHDLIMEYESEDDFAVLVNGEEVRSNIIPKSLLKEGKNKLVFLVR
jgi:hypothetical protein